MRGTLVFTGFRELTGCAKWLCHRNSHATLGSSCFALEFALEVALRCGQTLSHGAEVQRQCNKRRCRILRPSDDEFRESLQLWRYVPSSIPISSSGVQIIGGSNPLPRHVFSIFDRSCALAMCSKFHVKRYFTPFVAAREICIASRGSVSGIALDLNRASANSSASGEPPKTSRFEII